MTMSETQIKTENNSRKRTQEDRDIEEWALKLKQRIVPQIPIPGQTNGTANSELPPHAGFDIDSAIGKFEWVSIGKEKFIPCLFRNGQKYCCVRMVEGSVMGDLLNVLPPEIYHSAKLCSHFATAAEAKLLTYINSWHCDYLYGQVPFTEKDLVVTLQEVEEFYEYLMFAFTVLASGGLNKANDYSKCGFVRVNNESLIPYTVLRMSEPEGTEKGVPLFYFEGQTDILKAKAKELTGWDLAYLKVCCKVQGVKKELIVGDELKIVKLSDLKSYFPKRTIFTEQCWPPGKGKSLLPKHHLNGVQGHGGRAGQINGDKMLTSSLSSTTPTAVVRGLVGAGANSAIVHGMGQARRDIQVNIAGAQVNRPAQIVNAYNRGAAAALTVATTASLLHKIKATDPIPDGCKTVYLSESPDGAKTGAFKLFAVTLETGKNVHSINLKAGCNEPTALLIPHYVHLFAPGCPVNTVAVPILSSLGIPVYLPCTAQIRVLNANGYAITRNTEMPLVNLKDVQGRLADFKNRLLAYVAAATANRAGQQVNIQYVNTASGNRVAVYPGMRR